MNYSDSNDDSLNEDIELMGIQFAELGESYFQHGNKSQPSYINFYNEVAENYMDASKACTDYLHHNDIVEFVREMIDLGFCFEILRLKSKIKNTIALKKLEEVEKEFQSGFDVPDGV